MKVRPVFAWYDMWVGVFVDRPKRRVYIFPLPCVGIVITRTRTELDVCRKCNRPIRHGQYRFGSSVTGWEHMASDCPRTS